MRETTLYRRRIICGTASLRVSYLGFSLMGRPIILFAPSKKPLALVVGGIHGREHITCKLVLELAKNYVGERVAFIPMLNPDGVEISVKGKTASSSGYGEKYEKWNGGNPDLSLWKANARGTDLNVNFPADWGKGKDNKRLPSSENFIGNSPFSERETRLLRDYIAKINPYTVIAYHSKGEVIYYGYGDFKDSAKNLDALSSATGYPCEVAQNSCGGLKDWFIKVSGRPGYTIEVGSDRLSHPIPYSEFDKIYAQNKDIPTIAEEIAREQKKKEGSRVFVPDWYKL